MTVENYEVVTGREGKFWWIEVPAVEGAFSQARRLAEVEPMAREAISLLLEVPEDSFGVTVRIEGDVAEVADAVTAARQQAADAQARADSRAREAALELTRRGLSFREVAALLGVSPSWVSGLNQRTRDAA